MAPNVAGCVSRAKASAPRRAPGCFAWCAWDKQKTMSLMTEFLGDLAPHGVDDVSFASSLLSCFLNY